MYVCLSVASCPQALCIKTRTGGDAVTSSSCSIGNKNQSIGRDFIANVHFRKLQGKTTLVDAMLKHSNVFKEGQEVQERIMDANDLERERGITILSKNTALSYNDTKINLVDTPGHADFGGEVERVLSMADSVLLLVDAAEGPMPQTRFVLQKALELNHKVIVVVNKVDRNGADPIRAVNDTFDLFCELGADDDQCDFPVVYASAIRGASGTDYNNLSEDLEPLFSTLLNETRPPVVDVNAPLQLYVSSTEYDDYKGRMGLGRVRSGSLGKYVHLHSCLVLHLLRLLSVFAFYCSFAAEAQRSSMAPKGRSLALGRSLRFSCLTISDEHRLKMYKLVISALSQVFPILALVKQSLILKMARH